MRSERNKFGDQMLLLNRASFKNTVRSVRNKAYRFLQLCDISLDKLINIDERGYSTTHSCSLLQTF